METSFRRSARSLAERLCRSSEAKGSPDARRDARALLSVSRTQITSPCHRTCRLHTGNGWTILSADGWGDRMGSERNALSCQVFGLAWRPFCQNVILSPCHRLPLADGSNHRFCRIAAPSGGVPEQPPPCPFGRVVHGRARQCLQATCQTQRQTNPGSAPQCLVVPSGDSAFCPFASCSLPFAFCLWSRTRLPRGTSAHAPRFASCDLTLPHPTICLPKTHAPMPGLPAASCVPHPLRLSHIAPCALVNLDCTAPQYTRRSFFGRPGPSPRPPMLLPTNGPPSPNGRQEQTVGLGDQ
jgi:hypothetical protein